MFAALPAPMQARIDALAHLAYLGHDVLPRIEEKLRDAENFIVELPSFLDVEMAPMPCDIYVKQLDKPSEKKAA